MGRPYIDLTDMTFGNFTALYVDTEKHNKYKYKFWICKCVCGNKLSIRSDILKRGGVKSCGCLSIKGNPTHGMRYSVEYISWICMNRRCKNRKYYADRGITVCKEWRGDNPNGFINFYKDMGNKPNPKYTIDRIDSTKGYYKENCRWATRKQQAQNRSSNVKVTYSGITLSKNEWAELYGVNRQMLGYYTIEEFIRKIDPEEKKIKEFLGNK